MTPPHRHVPIAAGVIDAELVFAWASLHHKRCRAPGWNSGSVITQAGAGVSHRSRLVMMPIQGRGTKPGEALPMMVVNPSMESVMLRQDRGRWLPQFHSVFAAAGMVPPGRKLRIRRPVPGVTARLTPVTAQITLRDLPGDVYECDLDAENDGTDPFAARSPARAASC